MSEEDGVEVKVRAWAVNCSACWYLRPAGDADRTALCDGVRHLVRRGTDRTLCGLEMAP